MMFLTQRIKFLLNTIIRKEIMNAYHKLVLLLFYTIFALIVIFKSKELTKMSANHTILLFVAVFVLTIITVLKNKRFIEKFEEEVQIPRTTTTSSDAGASSNNDIDRAIVSNENHNDLLLSQSEITSHQIVFYYSCFQYSSFDFMKNTWSSIVNNKDKLTINTSDNLFGIYKQKDGVDLSENVMIEGLKSDSLQMGYYRMKQFTLFMYVNIHMYANDFNTYNIFELYSSNIEGNIALCVKIESKNLKIVYGGIELPDSIALNDHVNTMEPFLLTIVKSNVDSEHKIQIFINNGDIAYHTINNIDYDGIKYVSGNRNYIELSKEKFIVNKYLDQDHGGLNMKLLNFGMLNVPINVDKIKSMYNNLLDQRTNQLNENVIETTTKLSSQQETINKLEAELERVNACKLSPEVCGQCVGVDTSRFSEIQKDTKCYSAFNSKCELIKKDPVYKNNADEEEFCRFLSPPVVIEAASNCVMDNSKQVTEMKTISLDRVSRTDTNTPSTNQIEDIKYQDLYKPIEKPDTNDQNTPSEEDDDAPFEKESSKEKSNDNGTKSELIKDFVDGKMNKDELYKNIMDDYQKDLNNKIDEIEEEEEKSSSFVDFMKYFFFMK